MKQEKINNLDVKINKYIQINKELNKFFLGKNNIVKDIKNKIKKDLKFYQNEINSLKNEIKE